MSSTVGIIIQARLGSSRLPGKSLMEINEQSLIARCHQQCSQVSFTDCVIVAIPEGQQDDLLAAHLESLGVPFFRGSEHNLAERFLDCATQLGLTQIVRVTGDNPLLTADIIELVSSSYPSEYEAYVSTRHWNGSTFEGLFPKGLSVDMFPTEALVKLIASNPNSDEREHIVYFFTREDATYPRIEVSPPAALPFELSIDTPEDLERVSTVVTYFEKNRIPFSFENYCTYVPLALKSP